MNPRFSTIALSALLLVLAAFVWLSSSALPEVVASHFGANGAANGFMPRGMYVAILLALVLGVPSLLGSVDIRIDNAVPTRCSGWRRDATAASR